MKKIKWKNVLIIAALIAFLSFCVGMIFGGNTNRYSACAEEIETQDEQDGGNELSQSGTESNEETPGKETTFDLEAFLAFVQKYADEAGIGDDYAKAVEAIKTAASEKQVTLSTIASIAQLAVFVGFIIYKNVKDGKLKKQIVDLAERLEAQREGTNALIDETNAAGQTGTETNKTVSELKTSLLHLEKAFALFADRFKIGEASKEEIKRECVQAQKGLDGSEEVTENEHQA